METDLAVPQGPLADVWAGIGLIAFYIALIWINSLLGVFLTPLFILPATWLRNLRRRRATPEGAAGTATAARG